MQREIIDIFCHFLPPAYYREVERSGLKIPYMLQRASKFPAMADPAVHTAIVEEFPGYRQVPCLVSPYPDDYADKEKAAALSRAANEAMADFVKANPARYPGFVATVPWLYAEDACRELEYAVRELGAKGVQIGTPIQDMAPDQPRFAEIFDTAADLGAAVWLHPTMNPMRSDYATEEASFLEIWWSLGVPYESGAAMVRLAYSGLFERHPDLVVVTHHAGAIVPVLEGRFRVGMQKLGTRVPPGMEHLARTPVTRPIDEVLQNYYADTATLGTTWAIEGAAEFFSPEHVMFGTDAPFGGDQGRDYIRMTIDAVERMRCPDDVKEKIFSGNAKRVLNIV